MLTPANRLVFAVNQELCASIGRTVLQGGGNILQICAALLIASLISVSDIEPDDIFITSSNFRGFHPFIPGHIFDAFMLADAEPVVL